MNPQEFLSRIKNPLVPWELVDEALNALDGVWRERFFEDGHAFPIVMRALSEDKGAWLIEKGWSPVKSYRSRRIASLKNKCWISSLLKGKASEATDLFEQSCPSYASSAWAFAVGAHKNMDALYSFLKWGGGNEIKNAWLGVIASRWPEGAEYLLQKGASIETKDPHSQKNALILSIENSDDAFSVFLLDNGANPYASDGRNCFAYASAIRKDNHFILDRLIKSGLDINLKNHHGASLFEMAYDTNAELCGELLIDLGADLPQMRPLKAQIKRYGGWEAVLRALEARELREASLPVSNNRPTRRI